MGGFKWMVHQKFYPYTEIFSDFFESISYFISSEKCRAYPTSKLHVKIFFEKTKMK